MVEKQGHRVRVLYSCIICPKAFDNVQSLRAHMKVHQDIVWENFTVRLPKDMCTAFKEVCKNHKTTTCHVIRTLMKATIAGDETGLVDLAAANPLIVHMQEFFGASPRGHGKYDVVGLAGVAGGLPRIQCNFFGGVCEGKVYCRNRCYAWLPWETCSGCEHNQARSAEEVSTTTG